nr:MAG: ORF1 [TTV-like mini virus]
MPAYWTRPYRYRFRRRRYWYRSRRPRKTFRRRYYPRRQRWVSNKRKPIPLLQWQPPYIKKCLIKGKTSIINFTPKRLPNNSTMYEESIVPLHWPGGGSFCVTQMSLNALYSIHSKCRNWWTGSNVDLPLCRYKGTKLKFYQTEHTDYIVRIQTQLPSNSNKLTYPSCHPHIMFMSPGKIIIPSRDTQKRKKPYKTVWIKPPPQLQNKWYFQTDIVNTPLYTIHAVATSLQNYFLKPNLESTTITFPVLNTFLIQNRDMAIDRKQSWPYKKYGGTVAQYFYLVEGQEMPNDLQSLDVGHLIPLTNPRDYKPGLSYYSLNPVYSKDSYQQYFENYSQYWGNPFHAEILKETDRIVYATKSPEAIAAAVKQKQYAKTTWKQLDESAAATVLTKLEEDLYYYLQYNPLRDTGQDTQIYLLGNTSGDGWDPPSKPELILEGFPMWLGLFGYVDFQKKLKVLTNIDTTQIVVIKSSYTQRPHPTPIVPINIGFTLGHSPYESTVLPPDRTKWYIQEQYQEDTINQIVSCGPGIPYLPNTKSENIQMFYKSKFLWGGSPPKSVNIDDPSHQITYPVPSNQYENTSLQNPAQAPESLLYSFDQRHGSFTTAALDRITKDWTTQTFVTSITDPELRYNLKETFKELEATEEEEHEKEAQIRQQLQQLRHHQQCLRQRIISLLETKAL